MMHVTPMWMPMMIPVVEVLLFCSSFMQSQGGFRAARRKGREGVSGAAFLPLVHLWGASKAEPPSPARQEVPVSAAAANQRSIYGNADRAAITVSRRYSLWKA